VAVWSASGTHAGPFLDVPATGLPLTTTSVSVLRIAHGQIVEYAVHGDVYGVLQQLGRVTVEPVPRD
jgi:predicted ester cyclase